MTVLVATAGLMVMLASYHSLVMFNLRSSDRSYHGTAAMNLAETGLEEAMWAINKKRANSSYDYRTDGWTVSGDVATQEFTNVFSVGTSTSTYVKVKITNCNLTLTDKPLIKAQAILGLPNGMPSVEKWVEISLDATGSGGGPDDPPPTIGFVSKEAFKFNGNNPKVDSWDSDPFQKGEMTHRYDDTTKNDQGFVASASVSVNTITVSNADIKGYVATYQDSDLSGNVGPNGSILAKDSPAGTKIDPRRVSTDFTATFPAVTAPEATAVVTTSSIPAPGEVQKRRLVAIGKDAATGKTKHKMVYEYYYKTGDLTSSLEVARASSPTGTVIETVSAGTTDDFGTTAELSAPVVTDVALVVNRINLTGSDGIGITTGVSLDMYASGDVTIAGKGIANGTVSNTSTGLTALDMQQPAKLHIYGTATGSQTIKIAGNGAFSGVVYAPNGDVTFTGNTPLIFGAATAKTITISGNAEVHYDESLGKFVFGTPADSGGDAFRITLWRELLAKAEKNF